MRSSRPDTGKGRPAGHYSQCSCIPTLGRNLPTHSSSSGDSSLRRLTGPLLLLSTAPCSCVFSTGAAPAAGAGDAFSARWLGRRSRDVLAAAAAAAAAAVSGLAGVLSDLSLGAGDAEDVDSDSLLRVRIALIWKDRRGHTRQWR